MNQEGRSAPYSLHPIITVGWNQLMSLSLSLSVKLCRILFLVFNKCLQERRACALGNLNQIKKQKSEKQSLWCSCCLLGLPAGRKLVCCQGAACHILKKLHFGNNLHWVSLSRLCKCRLNKMEYWADFGSVIHIDASVITKFFLCDKKSPMGGFYWLCFRKNQSCAVKTFWQQRDRCLKFAFLI